MQDIKELVLLLEQHGLDLFQQPPPNFKENAALIQLYTSVRKGDNNSDVAAFAGNIPGASPATSVALQQLKNTLRTELIQLIGQYNTDLEQHTDPGKALFECEKQWLTVRRFTGQNAGSLTLSLGNQLFRIAQKFEYTKLCADISAFLRIQFCLRRHDNDADCAKAIKHYQYYRKLYDIEFQAEDRYTMLNRLSANGRKDQNKISALARKAYTDLQGPMRRYPSGKLHLYGYLIKILGHMGDSDYPAVLRICTKAIRFFENKPYHAQDPLQVFYYMQLIANIQLRRFAAGEKSVRQCLERATTGTFNWFKFQELFLMLMLHTGRFSQATEFIKTIGAYPKFSDLSVHILDNWRVYERYLNVLNNTGSDRKTAAQQIENLQQILNLPTNSIERPGVTTAGIFAGFSELLQQGNLNELNQYAGLVSEYTERFLNQQNTRRSYYFSKMLQQIQTGNFDRESITKATAGYLKKLKSVTLQVAYQIDEMEILPYEMLWEINLNMLEKRFRAQTATAVSGGKFK